MYQMKFEYYNNLILKTSYLKIYEKLFCNTWKF